MLEAINNWSDYRTRVREFDAVLEHGKAVSAAWRSAPRDRPQDSYGELIFAKLLAHSIALRRLAPDAMAAAPAGPADPPSMSALARCVIEAHDAFEYVAGHAVSESERSFRIRLWELNDAMRRLRILGLLGSTDPAITGLRADAARLQLALESHDHLATLPATQQAELRLRLRRADPPEFHLGQRERCEQSGVDASWHELVTTQLAHQARTLPLSVHQLQQFQAGAPETLNLLSQPLVFSLPFLVRVIQAATALMRANAPVPPSRTARTMQAWRALAAGGGALRAAR